MDEASMHDVSTLESYIMDDSLAKACAVSSALFASVGQAPSGNAALFHTLDDTCGEPRGHAGQVAFDKAIRIAGDAAAAADQGCYGETALETLKLPPDLQPVMPSVALGADCKGSFRLLATHNAELTAGFLFRLLKSADPCTNAELFATSGSASLPDLPIPECIGGGAIHLTGSPTQPTVDVGPDSSWHDKIVLLDRPISQICDYLDPSGTTGSLLIEPTSTLPSFAALPTPTLQSFVALPTPTLQSFDALPPEPVQQVTPPQPEGGSPTPIPPVPANQAASDLEVAVSPPDWTVPLLRQSVQIKTAGASGIVLATDNAGQLQAYSVGLSDQPQPIPLPDRRAWRAVADARWTVRQLPDPIRATQSRSTSSGFRRRRISRSVSIPLALPPEFIDPTQPLVWLPDAPKVLITLTVGSTNGIFAVDLTSAAAR